MPFLQFERLSVPHIVAGIFLVDQDLMDGPSRPVASKVGLDAPLIQLSCDFALTFPVMDKSAISRTSSTSSTGPNVRITRSV